MGRCLNRVWPVSACGTTLSYFLISSSDIAITVSNGSQEKHGLCCTRSHIPVHVVPCIDSSPRLLNVNTDNSRLRRFLSKHRAAISLLKGDRIGGDFSGREINKMSGGACLCFQNHNIFGTHTCEFGCPNPQIFLSKWHRGLLISLPHHHL